MMKNLYTEEEAKGMRCPHPLLPAKSLECEGGSCMAWRWNNKEFLGNFKGKDIFCGDDAVGYCGLAGKP